MLALLIGVLGGAFFPDLADFFSSFFTFFIVTDFPRLGVAPPLSPLALTYGGAAFLAGFPACPAPRATVLVVPSLNVHPPQAETPWLTLPALLPIAGMLDGSAAAAAQSC